MVAVRDSHFTPCHFHDWVMHHAFTPEDTAVFLALYHELPEDPALRATAQEMLEIVNDLHMDMTTLQAAFCYPFVQAGHTPLATLSPELQQLIAGVNNLAAMGSFSRLAQNPTAQKMDTLRHMLLTMVDDVRVVVLKLAERIVQLRAAKHLSSVEQTQLAQETTQIYAPLANRLGIGQLKWELEDLAFRYLQPERYQEIARWLDEKRWERTAYIDDMVAHLSNTLQDNGILGSVNGRPKHLYSIWRKMQKKQLAFSELYDVRAIRIITPSIKACYSALGIVHTHYRPLPQEFDDYIANPKPNGYQSIHTVVLGHDGKAVEIQIRTEAMHQDSELGVAAHWRYKEQSQHNSTKGQALEEKVAWLRQLLEWKEEASLVADLKTLAVEERVYVFTPKGEVIDLPQGSTPLDFAYHIHTDVGHRSTGARVNGKLVNFTYRLQTGDQVEMLTQKQPSPSRDWINPQYGFLRTPKARHKVMSWFKSHDRDKYRQAGKELFEKEGERHQLTLSHVDAMTLNRFHLEQVDDLFVALGCGDIRINSLINYLSQRLHQPDRDAEEQAWQTALQQRKPSAATAPSPILVEGVEQVLTYLAKCCTPVPGDTLQGFITQGRGIGIHRTECEQLKSLSLAHPERLLAAEWGEQLGMHPINVYIEGHDRAGLLRDMTTLLAHEKINIRSLRLQTDKHDRVIFTTELDIPSLAAFQRACQRLEQLEDIITVQRM